jgi:hypothetical protein
VSRLRTFFHVAHLHFNNFSCAPVLEPLRATAFEALFVSKRIGVVDQTRGGDLAEPGRFSESPHLA